MLTLDWSVCYFYGRDSRFRLAYEVFYYDWFDRVGKVEPEYFRVEVQLSLVGSFDVFCSPKTVLLPVVGDVGYGEALRLNRFKDLLGLVWRHDLVFKSLEQD